MKKEERLALAESYFIRIGDGHEHAISRPNIKSGEGDRVDRTLRAMVERANHNGDCIINVGNGYYRPIPGDLVDETEFREYISREDSRFAKICGKIVSMRFAFEAKRKEIAYAKQQAERKKGNLETSKRIRKFV